MLKIIHKLFLMILCVCYVFATGSEDCIPNYLHSNNPQHKGTASVSLAIHNNNDGLADHIGLVISGYGYADGFSSACCCPGRGSRHAIPQDGFPPALTSLIFASEQKEEGEDIVEILPTPTEHDRIKRNAISNHTYKIAGQREKFLWVVGFDLNPVQEKGCFCNKGRVDIWKRSEIDDKLSGKEKPGTHYTLQATSKILYEDAEKLIRLGESMYLYSHDGDQGDQSSVCYDAVWRNCGSFALQLLREASVPAPRIGSYCNLLFPLCPPWPCSINSTVKKARIGANNYENEHWLRKREGKKGLSFSGRVLRFFVFGFDK